MITPANRATLPAPDDPRDALRQSEKQASESQPGSFNDKALTDKIVVIPPLDGDRAPIEGLDPDPAR